MKIIEIIQGKHNYLIHDMKFDFYGKRLCTCSSDEMIKIWNLQDGEYKQSASWKGHNGAIWKVEWAYPGFGQIIASCSFDRSVNIWEEIKENDWQKKASLLDSQTKSVQDIKFAPFHIGLILATLSLDGHIRIYECSDIQNISHWSLIHDFICKGSTCLAWDSSKFNIPTIAIGTEDGIIKIYQYKENFKIWENVKSTKSISSVIHDISWSPSCGKSYTLIASGSKDGTVTIFKVYKTIEIIEKLEKEMNEIWRVEWNITGNILAVSDDNGNIKLIKNYNGKWKYEK